MDSSEMSGSYAFFTSSMSTFSDNMSKRSDNNLKKSVLIFDFDGTIADTFTSAVSIINRLAGEFHFNMIDPSEVEYLRGVTAHGLVKHLQIPAIKLPFIITRAQRLLHKEINTILPINGLRDILVTLKSVDIKMGILTSNSVENVTRFLQNHDMDFFDFIKTTLRFWGKTKQINAVIKKQKLLADQVLYIGDEIRDINESKRAGVQVAAVTWGFNTSVSLKAHNPDFLVDHPSELLRIVGL